MKKFLSLIGIGAVWFTCTGLIGLEVRHKPVLDFPAPQPLFRQGTAPLRFAATCPRPETAGRYCSRYPGQARADGSGLLDRAAIRRLTELARGIFRRERVLFNRPASPVLPSPFLSSFEARWRTERALETSA